MLALKLIRVSKMGPAVGENALEYTLNVELN